MHSFDLFQVAKEELQRHMHNLSGAQQRFLEHVCSFIVERDRVIEKYSTYCSFLIATNARLHQEGMAWAETAQQLQTKETVSTPGVAGEQAPKDSTGNTVDDLREDVASLSERCHAAEGLLESLGYVCTSGEWKIKRRLNRRKRVALEN